MIFQSCILQIDSTTYRNIFSSEHIIEFILLVVAAVVAPKIDWLLSLPSRLFSYINKMRKKEINSLWKFEVKSSDLKSGIHFNITSFKKAFYNRDSFKIAVDKFNLEKKNLILIGRSGLGKTRSAFEILAMSKKKYEVIIPFLTRPETFEFKNSFKKRKSVILFIDDLQKYDSSDINYYLENLIPNSTEVQLLCTCRIEHEENIFGSFQIPNLERYVLPEWTETEGRSLANLLNISFNEKAFDNTAASLIYKLEKLKEQYKQLKSHQKIILESIKLLKILDRYCNPRTIKEIALNIFDLKEDKYVTWRGEITYLKKMGFFDFSETGEVLINDIYLNELIELDFNSVSNRYFQFLKLKSDSGGMFYYGLFFERINAISKAENCYKEAITILPNFSKAYYRLGLLYLKKSDNEISYLSKLAKESISSAINYFLSAINLKSNDYSYFLSLGYAYSKAASIYDNLYHDKENAKQNLEQSILIANKAIEQNPNSAGAYRLRGFSNFILRNFEDAENDYKTACKLNSNTHHIYYLLGILYNEWGQNEKALENYRHCISLKKDFFQAYNDIGHILSKQFQASDLNFPEINILANDAVRNYCLSIWYSKGKHIVAYANLGHLYIATNEIDKAIKVQSIAIEKSPDYGEAYSSRAYAYNRLHEYESAKADLLKAIELNPNSENALSNLAFCYQQMGQVKMKTGKEEEAKLFFEKALSYYDKLIASNDDEQQISASMGKAITFEKMGDVKAAYEILNRLFQENSSNPKILSSIMRHLVIASNDEQVLNFLSVLLESIKQKKILSISKQIMEECTKQIQRLSKIKMLSDNLQELVELLKATFPKNYFVFKTSGIFNLNKGIMQKDFDNKMKYLAEAENDFNYGKSITTNNPVFLKYLGVVSSNKCIALKENLKVTNRQEDLFKYNEMVASTIKMFNDAEKSFPEYPELCVQHSVFLYSNQIMVEAAAVEEKARQLFAKQLADGKTNDKLISDELKELEEVKSKLATTQ